MPLHVRDANKVGLSRVDTNLANFHRVYAWCRDALTRAWMRSPNRRGCSLALRSTYIILTVWATLGLE